MGINPWSWQAAALLMSIPGSSCLSSSWVTFLGEHRLRKACHLSPPDGNATARGLLHPVGREQTGLSLLQVIPM